jgi:hypothetical protein
MRNRTRVIAAAATVTAALAAGSTAAAMASTTGAKPGRCSQARCDLPCARFVVNARSQHSAFRARGLWLCCFWRYSPETTQLGRAQPAG